MSLDGTSDIGVVTVDKLDDVGRARAAWLGSLGVFVPRWFTLKRSVVLR